MIKFDGLWAVLGKIWMDIDDAKARWDRKRLRNRLRRERKDRAK